MDDAIKELIEEEHYNPKPDETEEEKGARIHKMALDYCGNRIQKDWIDIQIMSAGSMDDMISGQLNNLDWNNGWFTCSKHLMRLCDKMQDYWTWDDGKAEEEGVRDDDFERASIAIDRMHAKIKLLEFEIQKLKKYEPKTD